VFRGFSPSPRGIPHNVPLPPPPPPFSPFFSSCLRSSRKAGDPLCAVKIGHQPFFPFSSEASEIKLFFFLFPSIPKGGIGTTSARGRNGSRGRLPPLPLPLRQSGGFPPGRRTPLLPFFLFFSLPFSVATIRARAFSSTRFHGKKSVPFSLWTSRRTFHPLLSAEEAHRSSPSRRGEEETQKKEKAVFPPLFGKVFFFPLERCEIRLFFFSFVLEGGLPQREEGEWLLPLVAETLFVFLLHTDSNFPEAFFFFFLSFFFFRPNTRVFPFFLTPRGPRPPGPSSFPPPRREGADSPPALKLAELPFSPPKKDKIFSYRRASSPPLSFSEAFFLMQVFCRGTGRRELRLDGPPPFFSPLFSEGSARLRAPSSGQQRCSRTFSSFLPLFFFSMLFHRPYFPHPEAGKTTS